MRALPIAALALLAACANGGDPSKYGGTPGVDVAEAALHGGAPQVALRVDEAILARDPRNVAALLNRGDAQTALQQPDAAAESYAEALRADPQSIQARIGQGRLHLADDPSAAEALFLEVLQRQPHNAVALNDLGIARDLLGRHQEAQASYRQAIGQDGSMRGAQVNLALSLAMAGRADDATPMMRPLASGPDASRKLRHDLAAVLAMAGDRTGAQRILARDLPPDQVDKALAIFAAASPASSPVRPTDTSPIPVIAPAAVVSSADPPNSRPVSRGPISGAPVRDSADSTGEPAGHAVREGAVSADPVSAGRADAGNAAPVTGSPVTGSPVASSPITGSPVTGSLVNGRPVSGAPVRDGADNAGAPAGRTVRDRAASADPANTDPVSTGSADPGNSAPVNGGSVSGALVRHSAVSAGASGGRVVRDWMVSATPVSATPVSATPISATPVSATPVSAGLASAGPAGEGPVSGGLADGGTQAGGPMVQLASMATNGGASAVLQELLRQVPDLLAERQPVVLRTENALGVHWAVRTAGFVGRDAAKGFCSSVKARGLDCYVIGS
jgi:Flp pilus assembly protein TadD